MFFPINLLIFAIAAEICVDNVHWKDTFGWTCRDYTRDPRECSSSNAVSDQGIEVQEACCICETAERRRDLASCYTTCSAEEDECKAECRADKAQCDERCSDDFDSTGGPILPPETPGPAPGNGGILGLETWIIILIVLGILLLLCIICVIVYLLCMNQDEGTCEDDCPTQQPMLVGGGCTETPCDAPCGAANDMPGGQMMYAPGPTGYNQGQGW